MNTVEARIEWKRILREAITNLVHASLDSYPTDDRLARSIDLESVLADHFGCINVINRLADRE